MKAVGASGLILLLITGELAPGNVLGFCVAASNAVGLIAGAPSVQPLLLAPMGWDMPLLVKAYIGWKGHTRQAANDCACKVH